MKNFDYCIIGAGIAGLGAAFELNKKGKKVTVLESNNIVGGRMATEIINDLPVDTGAKFLAPFYKNILKLSKELDVNTCSITANKFAIKRNDKFYSCNSKNLSSVLFFKGLSFFSKFRLTLGVLTQILKYKNLDYYDLKTITYLDNKNLYDHFEPIIGEECIDYFLDPALYSLVGYGSKLVSRSLFISGLKDIISMNLFSFEGGINKLCKKIAELVEVRCNLELLKIERKNGYVTLKVNDKKVRKQITLNADKVIMAIPGNKVLNLLKNPTDVESSFFSKCIYSPMINISFTGNSDLLKDFSTVWYPQIEDYPFNSFSKNFYFQENKTIFNATLRESYYNKLKKNEMFTKKYLTEIISKELNVRDVEIVRINEWVSGIPIFFTEYLYIINKFLNDSQNEKQIFYCGDYLQNPSTEGALTSGLNLAKRLEDL